MMAMWLGLALAQAAPCEPNLQRLEVAGDSLAGRVAAEDVVVVDRRPSNCWDVARGDWVLWQPRGRSQPVLKVVRAVGGDDLQVVRMSDGYHLWVNGDELRTANGESYALPRSRGKVVRRYQGTLPLGALLLLGDVPGGSTDSSRHGLIHHDDLIGRVVAVEPASETEPSLVP